MKIAKLLLIGFAAALGQAAMAQPAGCTNNCTITVEVTADATSCRITKPAKTDEFHVAAFTTTDITWQLDAPQGFEFSDPDGIEFSPSPPANTFIRRATASKREFVFTDKNDAPGKRGKHPYHIKVEKGGITCRLDPSVVND
jgi:hypothetical protein